MRGRFAMGDTKASSSWGRSPEGTSAPGAQAGAQDSVAELRTLVRRLADDLGVKVAVICETVGDGTEARTLALCVDGEFLESLTYKLAGTPCARACQRGVAYHARDVVSIYPEDRLLSDWEVEAYLGVGCFDDQRRLLGHVCVLHDGPIAAPAEAEVALRRTARRVVELLGERG